MRSIYFEKNIPKVLAAKGLKGVWPGVVWSPLSPTIVADLPEPNLPGPRWIKVKNRACGICATDLSLLFVRADPAIAQSPLVEDNARLYLGHEVVGTVVETGPGVSLHRTGDRVIMDRSPLTGLSPNCLSQEIQPPCRFCLSGQFQLCDNKAANRGPQGAGGGWSEGYTCHETEAFPCPPDLADDQAVLVEPMSVAVHAVLRRPPQNLDRVLVIGAGIIGLLVAQAVRAVSPGCFLAVVAKYPHQAELARRFGANEIIGREAQYATVARLTGGRHYTAPLNRGMILGGFDVIYDCVGTGTTLTDALRWARAGGAVVLVGIDLAPVTADLNPVWYLEVDLVGSGGHGADNWCGERKPTFEWVVQFLREGKLRADGLITHRFPLIAYRQAMDTATSKAAEKPVKVIFEYGEGA
jgi:threonine dehydrogenase-like Zn-dependent dehydrogenase